MLAFLVPLLIRATVLAPYRHRTTAPMFSTLKWVAVFYATVVCVYLEEDGLFGCAWVGLGGGGPDATGEGLPDFSRP